MFSYVGTGKRNIVLDHIRINGSMDGAGSTHTPNTYGIDANGSDNTINGLQIYNNNYGIHMSGATYNIFNNIQVYNNSVDGIFMESASNNNILNNIQSYNNNGNGIRMHG
jgi:parallel beta-helix repeat protein